MGGKTTSVWDNPYASQYNQRPVHREPETQVMIYGYPVTLEKFSKPGDYYYRIAVWRDGDQFRTKPLVEQRFSYHAFHETAMEAARRKYHYSTPSSPNGITEAFMLEWFLENRRDIEEAEYRRSVNSNAFTDLGTKGVPNQIPTKTFTGEDGRTYQELDIRGEDTDPILLEASERERIARRERQEAERRVREEARKEAEIIWRAEQQRKEREQAELEALEGWGTF
jgi:hypothetical protein